MISLLWQIYGEVSSHSLGFCSGNSAMSWRYKTLNKSEVINAKSSIDFISLKRIGRIVGGGLEIEK